MRQMPETLLTGLHLQMSSVVNPFLATIQRRAIPLIRLLSFLRYGL